MRILVPAHLGMLRGGVGTLARGLVAAMREAVVAPDEFVVLAGPRRPFAQKAIGGLSGPVGGVARLLYEQGVAANMARDFDLVHLMDSRPLLVSDTPFILTVHDVSYLDHPEWFPPWAVRYKSAMLGRALAKGPAAIICDSEHSRGRLLEHRPEAGSSDVRVIHPGISRPEPPPAELPSAGGGRPYFVTVAVVEPRKNHLTLLEAFRRARARGLELDWRIVGEPGHLSRPIIEALARADGVHVQGQLPPAEVEAVYAGARFAVTPSLAEGFGFPPLEAMARGVPLACSRGTALDETIGDNALRVEALDVDGWCEALLLLAGSEAERARLAQAGLTRVKAFEWSTTATRVMELYEAVHRRIQVTHPERAR